MMAQNKTLSPNLKPQFPWTEQGTAQWFLFEIQQRTKIS
jgi:hypothetical protein